MVLVWLVTCTGVAYKVWLITYTGMAYNIPYSLKFSRGKTFADFAVFWSTLNILSSKYLDKNLL